MVAAVNELSHARLPSVSAAYEEAGWCRRLVMSGLFLVVLLTGLGSAMMFWGVGSVVWRTFSSPLTSRDLWGILAFLGDLVAAGCGVRLLSVRSRHWKLEMVAIAAIVLSGSILWDDSIPHGSVRDDDVLRGCSVTLAHSGLPLAYLGAMTLLRRTRWMKNR